MNEPLTCQEEFQEKLYKKVETPIAK